MSDAQPEILESLAESQTAAHREVTRAKAMLLAADGLAERNGTTTLFAALNVLTGVVIGQCLPRHRNGEFLKFLRTIDRQVLKGLQIHMILDNYTSSSWLNMVERWFRELTEKAIRRGVFKSVPDLIAAIEAYLQANNNNPKPFVWTATAH
jgi:hypothetical protein